MSDAIDWNYFLGYMNCWTEYVKNPDGSVTCMVNIQNCGRDGKIYSHTREPISTYSPRDAAIVESVGGFK